MICTRAASSSSDFNEGWWNFNRPLPPSSQKNRIEFDRMSRLGNVSGFCPGDVFISFRERERERERGIKASSLSGRIWMESYLYVYISTLKRITIVLALDDEHLIRDRVKVMNSGNVLSWFTCDWFLLWNKQWRVFRLYYLVLMLRFYLLKFIASSREILTILIRDTDVIFKFFFLVTISKKLSQLVIQYNYYLNYFVASRWNLNYNWFLTRYFE